MAKNNQDQNQSQPNTGQAPAPPPAPQSDAQAASVAELKTRVSQLEGELAKAQSEHTRLEGELTKAREENTALKASLDRSGGTPLPPLPEGAFELLESVTVMDVSKARVNPRKGDVVMAREPASLQAKLGTLAKVYQVAPATIDELGGKGRLRRR